MDLLQNKDLKRNLKDIQIFANNILPLKSLGSVIEQILPDLNKVYNRGEETIDLEAFIKSIDIEEKLHFKNQSICHQVMDFKTIVDLLIRSRSKQLPTFLPNLLNHSAFQNENLLHSILQIMQAEFLSLLYPYLNENQNNSGSFPIKLKLELDDMPCPHFITITQYPSPEEAVNGLKAVKKYQGLCCLSAFICPKVEHSSLSGSLITISYFLAPSLKTWLENNTKNRRELDPDTITQQVELFARLFAHLQQFLKAEVNLSPTIFTPSNFRMLEGSGEWYFGLPDQVLLTEIDLKRTSKTNIQRSIGELMLASVSAWDLETSSQLFTTAAAFDWNDLEQLYKYSPILSWSKSLRGLLQLVLNSDQLLLDIFVDWDAEFRDFDHFDTENNPVKGLSGTYKMLDIPIVAEMVIETLYDNITKVRTEETTVKVPFLPERCSKFSNLKGIIDHVKSEKPYKIPEMFIWLESLIPPQLSSIIEITVEKCWEDQLKDFIFAGESEIGYIFKTRKREGDTFGSRIVLLLPKLKEENFLQLKLKPFGKLKLPLNTTDYYFDFLIKRTYHSSDLAKLLLNRQPEENIEKSGLCTFPSSLIEILNSGICIEGWIIHEEVGAPSLRDYINMLKNCGDDPQNLKEPNPKFTLGVINELFNHIQRSQRDEDVQKILIPESLFFRRSFKHDQTFKLPLGHSHIQFTTLVENNPILGKYKCEDEPSLASNLYSIGVMALELLAPFQFENWQGNNWTEFLNNLEIPFVYKTQSDLLDLIRKAAERRLTFNELTSLKGLNPSPKTRTSNREMQTTLLVEDDMVGVGVLEILLKNGKLKSVYEKSEEKTRPGFQNVLKDCLLQLQNVGIQNDELNFENISTVLNLFRSGVHGYSENNNNRLFTQVCFQAYYTGDEEFRGEIITAIKKVWLARFHSFKLVGHGCFGFVVKAVEGGSAHAQAHAIKFVLPSTEKEVADVVQEIKHWNKMRHPNVIRMTKFVDRFPFTEAELRTILEFADYIPEDLTESQVTSSRVPLTGSITKFILRSREQPITGWLMAMQLAGPTLQQWLDETINSRANPDSRMIVTQLNIVRDLIRGMKYLQRQGIMHCDLKPDNILFTFDAESDSKYSFPVQIADFGLSRLQEQTNGLDMDLASIRGNTKYQAPEVQSGAKYNLNAELYSIALIIMQILSNPKSGFKPFEADKKFVKATVSLENNESKETISVYGSLIQALQKMLIKDPVERMSCEEFQTLDFNWISL